jgi:transposase
MAENGSHTENSELSPRQYQLIAALVAGQRVTAAAAALDIGERTAHTWLKQPAFNQAYQDAKQLVFDEELRELKESKKLIRDMLLKHINAEVEVTPASQIQAAKLLLEQIVIAGEIAQLKEQLQELQATIEHLKG